MKRLVYYAFSIVLGVLLSFVIHALVEQMYIALLLANFARWSFGLSWDTLLALHHFFSLALLVTGVFGGYFLGVYWWKLVYIQNKRGLLCKVRE